MSETNEIDWSEGLGDEDAIAIGHKVVEMAEKLQFAPSAQASWNFEMDGEWFRVMVTTAEQN